MATLLQTAEAQAAISAELLQRYVYTGDETYIGDLSDHAAAAQAALNEALARGGPQGLQDVVAAGAQLQQGATQAATLKTSGNEEQAAVVVESLVPVFHDYRLELESMTESEVARVAELRARADRAGRFAFWLLVASGTLGAILGLAVSYQIARSIIRPLASLEDTARRVSSGDLSARAPVGGPREFAHLGAVLNEMMSTVEARTSELRDANSKLVAQNHELTDARIQAAADPLTSLGNHRSFHARLRDEAERVAGMGASLGLIIIDVDSFKEVNDSRGHQAGDELLREMAGVMSAVVSRENTYRYGGDEFAVLLPGKDQDAAQAVAHRIKEALRLIHRHSLGEVTASMGVASLPESAATPEELVYRADMAMYWAKSSGKNRVSGWDEVGGRHQKADAATRR